MDKTKRHPRRLLSLLLAWLLCVSCVQPAFAASETAKTVQLMKTEGTVSVTNSARRSISLIKNLRLFSGYHVLTKAKSYAWLNLDSAKLLKMDASSQAEVRKSGKKLEVLLCSGNLFFNVTKPLEKDETLNIRTSTTLTGVRGTCGWVDVIDRQRTQVCILEGAVECVVSDAVSGEKKTATIQAGEVATFTVYSDTQEGERCEIVTERCAVEDVPGYVLVELAEDEALCRDILDASGLDILGDLSQNGDPAAEARRRLEEEEREAANRLAAITAQEGIQANNVESTLNTSNNLNMAGTWDWRYDGNTKTLYIEGSGAMDDFTVPPWNEHKHEIESVVISAGITSIGQNAFLSCYKLTSITIPSGVTSIGGNAFTACSSLTGVIIPDSVTSIGESAFQSCTSLTSVTIPSSVTSIGNAAFRGCDGLTSITIPDSVTSIGDNTFQSCDNLASVTIPSSVTSIGRQAFLYCSNLTSVNIPDSVTSIGVSAFQGCTSLTSVTIPFSVTSIGDGAFWGCTSLTSVTIPSSVTSIAWRAFTDCTSLTSITIPNSVTSIEYGAFDGCGLTSVTIPDSVTSIGNYAFQNCASLTSVTIPNSVTGIGGYAFKNCTSLTSVTIPNSVTSIGYNTFDGCTGLTSITIPSSVTRIERDAFTNCTNLTDVYYSGSAEQWRAIEIKSDNIPLNSATIHYNSTGPV